jgi:hypothetical protein
MRLLVGPDLICIKKSDGLTILIAQRMSRQNRSDRDRFFSIYIQSSVPQQHFVTCQPSGIMLLAPLSGMALAEQLPFMSTVFLNILTN